MRNTIYVLMSFLLIGFTACDPDEKGTAFDGPVIVVNSNGSFSELDPVNFTIQVENGTASSMLVERLEGLTSTKVELGSKSFGSSTPANGLFTFDKTLVDLGLDKAGATALLLFSSEIEGKTYWEKLNVSVRNPISIGDPFGYDDKGAKVAKAVTRDGNTLYLDLLVETKSAVIDEINVESKVGSGGEWSPIALAPSGDAWGDGGTATKMTDSIAITGADYFYGDTLFYRVNTTSGALSSTATKQIIIGKWELANLSDNITLDNENMAFDLVEEEPYDEDSDLLADIRFVLGAGNMLGFTSDTGAEFVVSTKAVFTSGDRLEIMDIFEESVKLPIIVDVEIDDVFIYRTVREDDVYYGIIRVTNVYRTNTDNTDYFSFEYKYH